MLLSLITLKITDKSYDSGYYLVEMDQTIRVHMEEGGLFSMNYNENCKLNINIESPKPIYHNYYSANPILFSFYQNTTIDIVRGKTALVSSISFTATRFPNYTELNGMLILYSNENSFRYSKSSETMDILLLMQSPHSLIANASINSKSNDINLKYIDNEWKTIKSFRELNIDTHTLKLETLIKRKIPNENVSYDIDINSFHTQQVANFGLFQLSLPIKPYNISDIPQNLHNKMYSEKYYNKYISEETIIFENKMQNLINVTVLCNGKEQEVKDKLTITSPSGFRCDAFLSNAKCNREYFGTFESDDKVFAEKKPNVIALNTIPNKCKPDSFVKIINPRKFNITVKVNNEVYTNIGKEIIINTTYVCDLYITNEKCAFQKIDTVLPAFGGNEYIIDNIPDTCKVFYSINIENKEELGLLAVIDEKVINITKINDFHHQDFSPFSVNLYASSKFCTKEFIGTYKAMKKEEDKDYYIYINSTNYPAKCSGKNYSIEINDPENLGLIAVHKNNIKVPFSYLYSHTENEMFSLKLLVTNNKCNEEFVGEYNSSIKGEMYTVLKTDLPQQCQTLDYFAMISNPEKLNLTVEINGIFERIDETFEYSSSEKFNVDIFITNEYCTNETVKSFESKIKKEEITILETDLPTKCRKEQDSQKHGNVVIGLAIGILFVVVVVLIIVSIILYKIYRRKTHLSENPSLYENLTI